MLTRILAVCSLLFWCGGALAQDFGGFGELREEPINAPGKFQLIDDPTGAAVTPKVYSFTISPGACSSQKYDNGNSDCTLQSVRTQLYQVSRTQPEEAWYQWQMYLPADFPAGDWQGAGGLYQFAYFHNGECPHLNFTSETLRNARLSLQINRMINGNCVPEKLIDLGDIAAMRGTWQRFELHARWSKGDDGFAKVFINGDRVADYTGHTLNEGPNRTFFKFGIYLCCTKGVEGVREATNYFTGIQRGPTSSALYSDAEIELARQLQERLNALGCDVGTPDGIAGKRTREVAQTCRTAEAGTLPAELVASNVSRFLDFYSNPALASP